MVLMFLSIPMTFLLSPKQDKNIVNKIWYCLHSSTESENGDGNYNLSQIDFNKSYIDKYKKLYPNRKIINDHYPLERIDNINNVLGSYFNEADNVFLCMRFQFRQDFRLLAYSRSWLYVSIQKRMRLGTKHERTYGDDTIHRLLYIHPQLHN